MAEGAGGKEVGQISVRVVPNLDGFYRRLREAVNNAERSTVVNLDVDPNTGGLRAEIEAATDGISAVVDLDADTAGVREKIKAATSGLASEVNVKPDVKQTDFARALAEVRALAKAADLKLNIDINDRFAEAKLAAAIAKLKAEAAAAHIDINVGVDRSMGSRLVEAERDFKSFSKAARNAGDSTSWLSKNPDLSWGSLFLAIGALAAPAVGGVATLLAGLPSLFASAAAGAGAVALGIKGIEAAADNAGILTEGKKGKQKPGATLEALKSSVSQVFERGLTPQFEKLTTLMPVLETGFGNIAQGLVNMGSGVTNLLTSAAGMQQLQTFLNNTGNFFTALGPTIASFAQTFLTLATQGSNAFNILLTPLQEFAFRFEQMINRVAANGTLTSAFQGLSDVLGSVLDLFTRLFESGLQAMGQLGGPLTNFVKGFADAFIALMPALTSFSGMVANVLGAALEALTPAITAVTPALTTLFDQFGQLASGALLAAAPLLTQIAQALGTTLLTALQQIGPLIPQLVTMFSNLATQIGPQLAQSLPQIATAFGQLLGAVIQLQPSLTALALEVLPPLVSAFATLAPYIAGFIQGIAGMVTVFAGMAQSLAGFTTQATATAAAFTGPLVGAISSVVNVVRGAVSAVSEWVQSFVSGAAQVISTVSQLPGQIAAVFSNAASILFNAGKAMIQGLINGIKSMIGAAVDAASSVLGAIKNLIPHSPAKEGPFSGAGWTSIFTGGQAIGQSFNDGLRDGFQGVVATAQQLIKQVQEAISQGVVSPDLRNNLKQELKALTVEYDQLRVQRDQATDKGTKRQLSDQMKQVQALKDQLRLQSDQLGYSDQYGANQNDVTKQMGQQLTKMIDIGKNFAESNIKQFATDLGASGNGALPTIAEQGVGWLTGILGHVIQNGIGPTIQVNSVDEAMAVRQNAVNKQAMQFAGR